MQASEPSLLRRYAELAVRVGANVQRGQMLEVTAFLEHAPLVREVARFAYEAGAEYVDVLWIDQHVRKAMIELAPEERLAWTPPWLLRRLERHVTERSAHVAITGQAEPTLMSDLDPARVGRARARASSTRPTCSGSTTAPSTGRSSRTRQPAGRRTSSASPTSSGCGTRSRTSSVWTRPTRPPRSASGSTSSPGGRTR
jgi:leucyl aminopeptidase (aminopeptidase T)